jgi:molybdopterin-guanine dinucleotide biosynthesis protein A
VIAASDGRTQPLLGCYQPDALAPLSAALHAEIPVRQAVAALRPAHYEVEDADELFNINSPADLLQAAAMVDRRRRPASRR